MIPTTRGSLLNRLRSGHSEIAWKDFLSAYQPVLRNWVSKCKLTETDSEDLLAEIYLHLVPRLRRFTYSPERRFRGWLKQAVTSAIAKYWEKKRREIGKPYCRDEFETASWEECAEELIEEVGDNLDRRSEQVDAIVAKVKARIKPVNWEAFLLTYVEGMDCQEAARRLQIPLGTIHVARCRVRAMLTREWRKSLRTQSISSHHDL